MHRRQALILACVASLVAITALVSISAKAATAPERPGAVYVLTNQTANSIMVYARASDGTLSFSGSFPTGGMGAGTGADPLGSQGSLVLARWHRLLLAVNAGSNDVSVFAVHGLRLRLLGREPSGGTTPISLAVHGNLVYVLNAGGTPNIQGFVIEPSSRHLVHLSGSERAIAGGIGSAPAQAGFSPDGEVLMVTEKSTNQIDTWTVNDDGYPQNRRTTISSGATPFGFAFGRRDFGIVSEATPSALSVQKNVMHVPEVGCNARSASNPGKASRASQWRGWGRYHRPTFPGRNGI